jgi:hypothetical protein
MNISFFCKKRTYKIESRLGQIEPGEGPKEIDNLPVLG